jgi:hypothetical protein
VHYVRRVEEKFICDQLHPVGLLLRDAQKWATQQQTGASTPPPSLAPPQATSLLALAKPFLTDRAMNRSYEIADWPSVPAGWRAAGPALEASIRTRKLFCCRAPMHGLPGQVQHRRAERTPRGQGMRAAQLVWDAALAEFADDVIETASKRPAREPGVSAEPAAVCEGLRGPTPRKTYFEENGLAGAAAPKVERLLTCRSSSRATQGLGPQDRRAHHHGDQTVTRHSRMAAMEALGLNRQQEGR